MFEYPKKTSIIRTVFKLLSDILSAPNIAKLNELGIGIEGLEQLRQRVFAAMQSAESLSENQRPSDYQKRLMDCETKLILLMQVAFRHRKLELNEPIDLNFHKNNVEYLRNLALDEETHQSPIVRAIHHYIVLTAEILNLRLLPRNTYDHNVRNFIIKSLSILRLIFNLRTEFKTLSYEATDNISADFFNEVAMGGAFLFRINTEDRPYAIKGFIEKLLTVFNEQLDYFDESLLRSEKSYYAVEGSEASRSELITISRIRQQRETISCFKNLSAMNLMFLSTMRHEVDELLKKMEDVEQLSSALTLLTDGQQAVPDNLRVILKHELENIYIKAHLLHMESRFFVETEDSIRAKSDLRLVIYITVGMLGMLEDEKLDGPLYTSIKHTADYRMMIENMTPDFLKEYFSRKYSKAIYTLIGLLCVSSMKNTLLPVFIDNKYDYMLNEMLIGNLLMFVKKDYIRAAIADIEQAENFSRNLYCAGLGLCKLDYERITLALSAIEADILVRPGDEVANFDVHASSLKGYSPIHQFIHNLVMHMNADDSNEMDNYFAGSKENLSGLVTECRISLADCKVLDEAHIDVRAFLMRYAPLVMGYAKNAMNGQLAYEAPVIQVLMKRYYQHLFDRSAALLPGYLPNPKSVIKPPVDKSSFVPVPHPASEKKLKLASHSRKPASTVESSRTYAPSSHSPTIDSDFSEVFSFYKGDASKIIGFYQKYSSSRHNVTTRAKALLGYAATLPHIPNHARKIKDLIFQGEKMFDKSGELFSFSPDNHQKFETRFNELMSPFMPKPPAPEPRPAKAKPPIKSMPAAVAKTVKSPVKAVKVVATLSQQSVAKTGKPVKKAALTSVGIFKTASVKKSNSHIPPKPQDNKRGVKTFVRMEKSFSSTTTVSKEIFTQAVTRVVMEKTSIEKSVTPSTVQSRMKLSLHTAKNINFTPFDPFDGCRVNHHSPIGYTLEQKNMVGILYQFRMHPVIHGGAPYDKLRFGDTAPISRSRDIDLHVCASVDSLMTICKANADLLNLNLALSRIDGNHVALIVFNSKLENGEYDSLEINCLPVNERNYKDALIIKGREFLVDRLLVCAYKLQYLNLNGEYHRVAHTFQIHLTVDDERKADECLLRNRHRLLDIIKRCAKPRQRAIPMNPSDDLSALILRNWLKLQRSHMAKIKMKQFDSLFLQGFTQHIIDVKCENRQLLSILFPSLEHVMDDDTLADLRFFCIDFDRRVEAGINQPRHYDNIFAMRVEFLTKLLLPCLRRRYNELGPLLSEMDRFTYACKRLLNESMFDLGNKYDVHNPFDARDTLVRRLIKTWHETLTREIAAEPEVNASPYHRP